MDKKISIIIFKVIFQFNFSNIRVFHGKKDENYSHWPTNLYYQIFTEYKETAAVIDWNEEFYNVLVL